MALLNTIHQQTYMKKQNRGFTLIELLVVIAIIGILSAVVLASLNTARSKGSDAAIMADVTGIRTQAAIYYTDHNNYGSNGATPSADCADVATVFGDPTVTNQMAGAVKANGGNALSCYVSAKGAAYAISSPLVATPTAFFCVDSTGVSTTTTAAVTTSNC
jgi:prepilin-type N-terminal cleavage/methylation domain-containing protein